MDGKFINDFDSGFTPNINRVTVVVLGVLCVTGLFGISLYSFVIERKASPINASESQINNSVSTPTRFDPELRYVQPVSPPSP